MHLRLHVAAVSLKRSTENILEVALRQTGGQAARAAALRALSQDKHNAAGTIRVLVRELDATTEHAVFLGSEVCLRVKFDDCCCGAKAPRQLQSINSTHAQQRITARSINRAGSCISPAAAIAPAPYADCCAAP